jgi:copper oxidase (laccase) domain-containing protein
VLNISGGTWCTATDSKKFFSHRRDGLTGRMATIVALLP